MQSHWVTLHSIFKLFKVHHRGLWQIMTGMDKGDGEICKWMKEDVNDGRRMKDGGRKDGYRNG